MDELERNRLMHAVLDGTATPDEVTSLQRLLHNDPAASDEFDELRELFEGLRRVPQPPLPPAFAERVLEALPRPRGRQRGLRQLFLRRRVFGPTTARPVRRVDAEWLDGMIRTQPANVLFMGGEKMSERTSGSFGKRSLWIGGGIAAVASVLAVSFWIEFPSSNKDTVGTVVPAQRYRAPQNAADDMKPGNDGNAQSQAASLPNGAATALTQGAISNAAQGAVAGSAQGAVAGGSQQAVSGALQGAAAGSQQQAVSGAVQSAAGASQQQAVSGAMQGAVAGSQQQAVSGAVQGAVAGSQQQAVSGAVQGAVAGSSQQAVSGAVQGAVAGSSQQAVSAASQSAVSNAASQAVGNAASNAVAH
jgi:hypothetical protein